MKKKMLFEKENANTELASVNNLKKSALEDFIHVTSNSEYEMEVIKYAYNELVKNHVDGGDYTTAFYRATDLSLYMDCFYLLQNYFKDEKMIFIRAEGVDGERYYLLLCKDEWIERCVSYFGGLSQVA